MSSGFRAERRGTAAYVTLDRPDALNALDWATREELGELWRQLSGDRSLRCVVLTGAGRAFCAGADVSDLGGERRPMGEAVLDELCFVPGPHLDVPVIVGVNGVCAGAGLHFVADADVVVAAASASFVDPHVNVGQVSGIEPASLALRMPLGVVSRFVLLGRAGRMSAADALAHGLVSEVVEDDHLPVRLDELVAAVAAASPTALARSRRLLRTLEWRVVGAAMQEGWDEVQRHWEHPDTREGPAAFGERRPPRWEERES